MTAPDDALAVKTRPLKLVVFALVAAAVVWRTRCSQVSLAPHASAGVLTRSYDDMRRGLAELAQAGTLDFLDCSRVFDGERPTTFTDMWHFTDFGHAILGRAIAAQVAPLLRRRPPG